MHSKARLKLEIGCADFDNEQASSAAPIQQESERGQHAKGIEVA
jgi:hypothetical protein